MTATGWAKWLGKRYDPRADPTTDAGAGCLLMVVRLREGMGLPVPTADEIKRMLDLAEQDDLQALLDIMAIVRPHAIDLKGPEDGAFVIKTRPKVGVAACVNGGMLYVHHINGVCWTNLAALDLSRLGRWRHWQ